MRVKISTNPPLPPIRAWFLVARHDQTIASFKSLLCASLSAFGDISPSSLRLSIDDFELLDNSELDVVRDGDLISVDTRDVPEDVSALRRRAQTKQPAPTHARSQGRTEEHAPRPQPRVQTKRKRSLSSGSESDTESSSSSDSESESESDTSTSSSGSGSEADVSSERVQVAPKPQLSTFVPPGYGKPQTRARNLRRRRKRIYEQEATEPEGPVSGANAVEMSNGDVPGLMSLSLRNKNKAKNFKALMNKPLPAKIVFGEQQVTTELPRLVPPSRRSSLPPNVFVTSVDVEKVDEEDADEEVDVDKIEAMAHARWSTLAKPTRGIAPGTLVGYKALGIDPVTFTPGHVLTVARVQAGDADWLVVRPMRAVSFCWTGDAEEERHAWEEIDAGDWRVL